MPGESAEAMSPYLAATELTMILPQGATVGASTLPLNLGEVASMVVEVGEEVDGYLAAQGHTVPVGTALAGFPAVQRIVKNGVAAEVLSILLPNVGGPGGRSPADRFQKAYDDALKALKNGDMIIVGLGDDTGETGRALPRSFTTSHPVSDLVGPNGYQTGASAMIPVDWQP
jgi:hypothetical protein